VTTGTMTLHEEGTGANRLQALRPVTSPTARYERLYLNARTTEVYFVADVDADGDWTNADPVVRPASASGGYDADATWYRDTFQTEYTFPDGSTAVSAERILGMYLGSGASRINPDGGDLADSVAGGLASFDVNGDLSWYSITGGVPETVRADAGALYSSVVMYGYLVNHTARFPLWESAADQARVFGVRFYTEHSVNGRTVGTTYILEEIFSDAAGQPGTPVARSVTRQRVEFVDNAAVSRVQRMRVTINPGTVPMVVNVDHNGLKNAAPRAQDAIMASLLRRQLSTTFDSFADDFDISTEGWR
jgi:hypothetical protein